jgi:hypothetical protein
MSKKSTIEVWTVEFYKIDEDGNELLDQDGNIRLFVSDTLDYSDLTTGLEDDDLEEIVGNFPLDMNLDFTLDKVRS